jgi:hypothetical protein
VVAKLSKNSGNEVIESIWKFIETSYSSTVNSRLFQSSISQKRTKNTSNSSYISFGNEID